MVVYVDDMHLYPMGQFYRMKMSHMIADTDKELHAMAKRLGLKREWYQGDHYDVSKEKRSLAVKYGAVSITLRQLSCMAFVRRVKGRLPKLELAEIEWCRVQYQLGIRREEEQRARARSQKGKGWKGNAAKIRL